ncbi:MAG TPA: glycine cleavage system protein H [Anaeromyxobacteraceae bacterium]|nr:glycine cleavage system protein H [Anaeromyxobacteraceae bacterium]
MEGIRFVDIYAMKGIEYLIVIGFLAAFVLFCRTLSRPRREAATVPAATDLTRFRVPEGLYYHQGHSWLRPEPGALGVVGLDDFAQKLVGKVDSVQLPPVGTRLEQGARGWNLVVDSVPVSMLSPVNGEVVEVNPEVVKSPRILREDPYGKGWLLKVKSSRIATDTHNLLSGRVARAWMENALEKLRPVQHEGVGLVLQDGGAPVEGIARMLGGEHWVEVAREHLLVEEPPAAAARGQ